MADDYVTRVADGELARRLAVTGAVALDGPKACGKTRTASRVAETVYRLLTDRNIRTLAETAPELLFDAETPILFDEWQIVPDLWNHVKEAVDAAQSKGLYLLTGSATPDDDIDRHSGSGRIAKLRMRPMSLYETGHSTGAVSLADLFDGNLQPAVNLEMKVPDILERIAVGGWPALLNASASEAQEWLQDYLETIIETDIPRLGTRRDPTNVRRLLTALGRATGTAVTIRTLQSDVGGASGPAHRDSILAYLDALERLMLTEDVPAWAPHMRSTTPLRKDVTRFMVDPSLGVAALGQGPRQLLLDLNAAGFHFESLVARDLRVYSQSLRGTLSHWRDYNDHEVDLILTLGDGRWAAVEVKLGPEKADEAADSLIRFRAKVDTAKVGEPSFMAVVTSTGPAHVRSDGVMVVPLPTLGP